MHTSIFLRDRYLKFETMRTRIIKSTVVASLLFLLAFSLKAQVSLKLDVKSKMTLSGTSSLHDWESDITKVYLTGTGSKENGKLALIESLTITVPVKAIKSGKSLMDDKTYNALLADKYPDIRFEINSVQLMEGKIESKGTLTFAGMTKVIDIKANYSFTTESTLNVKGSQRIDMTQFGVNPPTALMGTVTTGKDVSIPYEIIINY